MVTPPRISPSDELKCGQPAAGRVSPFIPRISKHFELPIHVGKWISAWDTPEFMPGEAAHHMRVDDYVVGLVVGGKARAYPLWITDNYHVINDHLQGVPIVFTTCERCQSGAAYLAERDGQRVKFAACGMSNASLIMTDRVENASIWLHYEGVCIAGERVGEFLTQDPTFHTTWDCWREWHPESDVMLAPVDRHHRDARHGHAREEYFSRPGMDRPLVSTISGPPNDEYPEHEMVLGINVDKGIRAYPLLEVKRNGGVVEDMMGDHPIVILAGPRPEDVTMAAYSRLLEGGTLSFRHNADHFVDSETGSLWNIEGKAVDGPLQGNRLNPVRSHYVRWHAWVYPHSRADLYRSPEPLLRYPAVKPGFDTSSFEPLLKGLSQLSREIRIEGPIVRLRLPHEVESGLGIRVGEDRLNLYLFQSVEAAEDYTALEGAWTCTPLHPRWERKCSRRTGRFVLASDPESLYVDPFQIVRIPDSEIQWADLVRDEELVQVWSRQVAPADPSLPNFTRLLEHLRKARFDIVEVAFLPHSQLRVGSVNALGATVNADRFAIYKCPDPELAERVRSEFRHAIQVGRFVFRSIPVDMYKDPFYEIGEYPDPEIRWSKLLEQRSFVTTVQQALEEC